MMVRKFRAYMKLLLTVLACLWLAVPVQALSQAQLDMFAENNIIFYDPDHDPLGGACYTGNGTISVQGDTAAKKVWSALRSAGFSAEQTAGIMGNMKHESNGLNPAQHEGSFLQDYWDKPNAPGERNADKTFNLTANRIYGQDPSYGLGLIQFSFLGRALMYEHVVGKDPDLEVFFNNPYDYSYANNSVYGMDGDGFIAKVGENVAGRMIALQVEFLKMIIDGKVAGIGAPGASGFPDFYTKTTWKDAAEYFLVYVENPNDTDEAASRPLRLASAEAYYDDLELRGMPIRSSGSGGRSSNCSTGGGMGLAAKAVSMAWPNADGTCSDGGSLIDWKQNESACHDDIKPEYRAAMERTFGAPRGDYCGTEDYPGSKHGELDYYQDCGHFVATVVRDSGVDPNYPSGYTLTLMDHMRNVAPEIWEEIPNIGNTSNLQPGDILVAHPAGGDAGHIKMYVGSLGGEHGSIAHASLCGRTANLGEMVVDFSYTSDVDYSIFRAKVGGSEMTGELADNISALESGGVTVGVAVAAMGETDSGNVQTAGSWTGGRAWSTIKVPLAIATTQAGDALADMQGGYSPYNNGRDWCDARTRAAAIDSAIHASDNCAAWVLWLALGGDNANGAAAEAVMSVLKEGKDEATDDVPYETRDPGTLTSGQTDWMLVDQAMFAANMASVRDSAYTINAMKTHANNTDKGVGLNTLTGEATKGGWGGYGAEGIMRQFGIIPVGNGQCSAVAIGVKGLDSTAGASKLTEITDVLKNYMNQDTWPSGPCPAGF